jgi:hypothetical protein
LSPPTARCNARALTLYFEDVVALSASGPYRHGNGSCVKVYVEFAAPPAWLRLSR